MQTLWTDNDCNKRICAFYAARFGVLPDSSGTEPLGWGSLADKYKTSWTGLGCNTVLGGQHCPAIPGYVGTPGLDRLMDELGYFPYNTSAACTANPNCKGFSSTGFIKSSASPNTVRPNTCWYSRLPAGTVGPTAAITAPAVATAPQPEATIPNSTIAFTAFTAATVPATAQPIPSRSFAASASAAAAGTSPDGRCTFTVRTKAGTCWLKSVPLTGTKGTNAVSSGIDQTCFKRSNTGAHAALARLRAAVL
ncbi:hypothetical protein GPECTOR_196g339 [Gonium pectorale]|uniref:Uncharacterized protein n=1 Tax=Gonium pectorale TaxID=33097 RepID=A0A150FX40_GONPE|nr:hypothetical protein GPECTOR_196g339 [Gonium pectorale]|eukprot:KXZ42147.1 hypothetical protein GPECTOR_196g339 [Gonium pectorale]